MRISRGNPHGLELLNRRSLEFQALGPVNYQASGLLTYAVDEKNVEAALKNTGVEGVVTSESLVRESEQNVCWLVADDPRAAFFRFHNWLDDETDFYAYHNTIDRRPRHLQFMLAHISPLNVTIDDGAKVMPGAVIGCSGARIIYPTDGSTPFRVLHVGGVDICEGAWIGANSVVVKSLWPRRTRIGRNAFVGNLVNVGHNVQVGDGAVVLTGAILGGSSVIGEGATIGLGAIIRPHVTVGDGAYVSMGAVATKDVPPGVRVSGNFAVEHNRLVEHVKEMAR